MESLYLNKHDSLIPIKIIPEITKQLNPHQITGLRFLYRNIINNKGVIINDSEYLGKRATIASLLHALLPNTSKIISSTLILCSDENQIDNWQYILETFTGLNTVRGFNNDSQSSNIVIEQISTTFTNLPIILSQNFDLVISEWPGLKNWREVKPFLSNIKTRKRILISNSNLLENLEDLWECVEWTQKGLLGNLAYFKQKYSRENIKIHQILLSSLRDILINRNYNDVDLPIIDEELHKKRFETWKENQNLKLFLSDSQTSSDSQSTNNIESIPKTDLKEKMQSKAKDFSYFEPPLTSDSSLGSNVSNQSTNSSNLNSTPNKTPEKNKGIIEFKKDQDKQKYKTNIVQSSESLEMVSAHVVSPSNYTPDEAFDALNFLFPSNENNIRKRRSNRKKITESKWLKCPKTADASNDNLDLMQSSDDSDLNIEAQNEIMNNEETTQDIINRTLLSVAVNKTKNKKSEKYQKGKPTRDNEAEDIIDSIFFS